MLAELLEELRKLSVEAAGPKPIAGDARTDRYIVPGHGSPLAVSKPPAPRAHTVSILDDLIALANRFVQDEGDNSMPVVWYNESQVVLVIDDNTDRLERVTLKLTYSDVFMVAAYLRKEKPWLDQKKFYRLLKIELNNTLDPGMLLNVIKKIKFENGQTVHAEIGKAKESMGRQINAEVSAEAEVPEEVTLQLPVYKTLGETETYLLYCTVEVDPLACMFRLMPAPDQIERVGYLALGDLARRLKDGLNEAVPAYYGSP